jgi:hypothetical protein
VAERRSLVGPARHDLDAPAPVRVGVESTAKRTFASALDWPGWSRAGRDEAAAVAALRAAGPRYAAALVAARLDAPNDAAVVVTERLPGTTTTEFGAPDITFAADGEPVDEPAAARLAALVRAAWDAFDAAAGAAPAELRKGPRGGGRDRDKLVAHVDAAEAAYGRRIGLRLPEPAAGDAGARAANRAAILEVLGRPSDGGPVDGGRWPARYAARRIAWHALDHAWEIEDRSVPAE